MKARVALAEGFRIHRTDNTFFDVKQGDVVETDDIPGRQREERLMDKHLVPITDAPKAAVAADAAKPKGK